MTNDLNFDEVDDEFEEVVEPSFDRRKEDKLEKAKKTTTIFQSLLYTDPELVRSDGEEKIVRKVSWKKIVSSSIFSFVVMWAVWCTITIFGLSEKTSVTAQKVTGMQANLKEEVVERKDMDKVLHQRVSKVDDFSRDQIRLLHKAIHDYRMVTFDKVDNAKETLINMMIRILENQEKFKEEVKKADG
jgi:hypothetical protein